MFGGTAVNSRKIAVVGLLGVVIALAACRREEAWEPMKLGADAAVQDQAAR
jgi:hypothetical protein